MFNNAQCPLSLIAESAHRVWRMGTCPVPVTGIVRDSVSSVWNTEIQTQLKLAVSFYIWCCRNLVAWKLHPKRKIPPLPGAINGTQCSMDRKLIMRVTLECIACHARMIMPRISTRCRYLALALGEKPSILRTNFALWLVSLSSDKSLDMRVRWISGQLQPRFSSIAASACMRLDQAYSRTCS